MAVRTSPACSPASAATDPDVTVATSTLWSTPKYSARCGPTSVTSMPSRCRPRSWPSKWNSRSLRSVSGKTYLSRCSQRPRSGIHSRIAMKESAPSPGVTLGMSRSLSRMTSSGTSRPTGVSSTNWESCRALRTRSTSNSTTMSPSSRPTSAAWLPRVTALTMAPSVRDPCVSDEPRSSMDDHPPSRTILRGRGPRLSARRLV
jgi:hypothetical protein